MAQAQPGIPTSRAAALGALAMVTLLLWPAAATYLAQAPPRVVLIVVDGLRPDQVTPEVMPRLHGLGARGMVFDQHHSVTPTVTRVNASSMATGSYPETHGILGNTIYSAATFPARGVNTSSHDELEAMTRAEGRLITADTLGVLLERAGKRFVVFSAGSSGSALLLSHPLAGNGAVVNPELIRPEAVKVAVIAAVGAGPKEAVPNTARNRWMVDAYLALAPTTLAADVTAFWFADPDETAHATGLASAETTGALRAVDGEIGRIEDDLRARSLGGRTTFLVASDHGFSTHTGELTLAALVAPFAEPLPDGTPDLVVTEGAINVRRSAAPARAAAIVAALQARPEVGAIFTAPARPGALQGVVPGTLALDVARWRHARSAPILVSGNWSRATNAAGAAGTTTQSGVAGHGTTSPYDVHNVLIAAGAGIRTSTHGVAPTSNADLAPTILTLVGAPVPASMTGRAITEMRTSGPPPSYASR
jgi:arylsulfatase A-like enzyme